MTQESGPTPDAYLHTPFSEDQAELGREIVARAQVEALANPPVNASDSEHLSFKEIVVWAHDLRREYRTAQAAKEHIRTHWHSYPSLGASTIKEASDNGMVRRAHTAFRQDREAM